MAIPLRNAFNKPDKIKVDNFVRAANKGDYRAVFKFIIKYPDAIDVLDQSYVPKTALMAAAQHGHKDVVELLLKKGAAPRKENKYQETAFEYAVRGGHKPVAEFLLEKGAALEGIKSSGWTPLMMAAHYLRTDVVKFLLEKGADASKTYRGKTPLVMLQEKSTSLTKNKFVTRNERDMALAKAGQIEGLLKQQKLAQKLPQAQPQP
jgi:ankyrin repeat protein